MNSLAPFFCLLGAMAAPAENEDASAPLGEYIRIQVERIAEPPLLGIETGEEWKARRPELQRRMRSMLGLEPLPDRTPLNVQVRAVLESPDFVVENLLFESMPGLYVTGNLYRPKEVDEPLPAVLYVCGHAQVEKDGVIYGNKAHYQHHAAWYAANGFVCLVVDTLQRGEVPGLHHGLYYEEQWWWQGRGYTPAGLEAWNGIRAIDYLTERPEVDPERIGVTGRSGGGATSWWLGAIDDRLAAVIPVAGITDLHDHLIEGGPDGRYPDGVIEGHCDCMYMVNTYRWDFDAVAALVAPKPLLVENTNADAIFPEAGVRRLFERLERVYDWYGARDRLDLVIGEGGHVDSVEIRHPSFAFMKRWLADGPTDPEAIEEPDRSIPIEQLKVLDVGETLDDAINDRIEETFVPKATPPEAPTSARAWNNIQRNVLATLQDHLFLGWPDDIDAEPLNLEVLEARTLADAGLTIHPFAFDSMPGARLVAWAIERPSASDTSRFQVRILTAEGWEAWRPLLEPEESDPAGGRQSEAVWTSLVNAPRWTLIVAPQGVGPTAWPEDEERHLRRKFALIGQTLDELRIWDVRRVLRVADELSELDLDALKIEIKARDDASIWALFAALFDDRVATLELIDPPGSLREGPAILNAERHLTLDEALIALGDRRVVVRDAPPDAFDWLREAIQRLGDAAPVELDFVETEAGN